MNNKGRVTETFPFQQSQVSLLLILTVKEMKNKYEADIQMEIVADGQSELSQKFDQCMICTVSAECTECVHVGENSSGTP